MQDRLNALKQAVLEESKKVLLHAADKLRGNGSSIRNAMVANVRETMDWLRDLNIDNDDTLLSVVKNIERTIVEVGGDELRENDSKRYEAYSVARAAVADLGRAV
jgi:hypothetical protein